MKVIIITAADSKYFELVQGTILSLREKPQGQNVTIGFFDLGCTLEELQWLQKYTNIIKQPDWDFDFRQRSQTPEYIKGLLVRPHLRKYFPNFDIYLWIDADAWVQDWSAIDLFIQGAAKRRGLAIVPELHRASLQQYGGVPEFSQWIYQQYKLSYEIEIAEKLCTYPMLNAGVFSLHKDAPHWERWKEYLEQGLRKNGSVIMTDQLALNLVVYLGELFNRTEMLPPWCNWIFNGYPVLDKQQNRLVETYLPHTPIGILHLAGRPELNQVKLLTTTGDIVEVSIRYQPRKNSQQTPLFPLGDYVSPGWQLIQPDRYFPQMIIGDRNASQWPYLRREIPHNWYVDQRYPYIGFANRDEAHILYNTALIFRGKNALEIGCWMGWSACHLALGGVNLDVIDPSLEKPEIRQSVIESLQGVISDENLQSLIILHSGYSPGKVEELALQGKRWSLIFIDGEHGAPGPLNDAIVCEKYAEQDAMILFHDLIAPDVAAGLFYLREKGWQTMIYQTMQIMGVAWRGNVEPIRHQPDPTITWELPTHLQIYRVSEGNVIS
jgi:predicted O-methyltransferase YrrM